MEKLAVLESTSRDLLTGIVVVQTELAAIGTPVRELHTGLPRLQDIPAQLDRIETLQTEVAAIRTPVREFHTVLTRFQEMQEAKLDRIETLLNHQLTIGNPAGSVTPQQDELRTTHRVATGRLLAKPSALREICEVARAGSSLERNERRSATGHDSDLFWSRVASIAGHALECRCRRRGRIRRNNFVWSSLVFSVETTASEHLPGCLLGQGAGTYRSRKLSVWYTGLGRLLNSALQLSFGMTRGAGGWSISPSFTYYPTVDAKTAPAFRILTLLKDAVDVVYWEDKDPRAPARLEEWVALALVKLVRLFQTRKASPLAVDSKNQSLVHYAAEMVSPKFPVHHVWTTLTQPYMASVPKSVT